MFGYGFADKLFFPVFSLKMHTLSIEDFAISSNALLVILRFTHSSMTFSLGGHRLKIHVCTVFSSKTRRFVKISAPLSSILVIFI